MAGNANSGRRRKPLALKLVEGTASRADFEAHRRTEAALPSKAPDMPDVVAANPHAAAEWSRVAPLLEALHSITEADRSELAGYVMAWADFAHARGVLDELRAVESHKTAAGSGLFATWSSQARRAEERMRVAGDRLGLNPAARAKLLAGVQQQPGLFDDGLDRALAATIDHVRRNRS